MSDQTGLPQPGDVVAGKYRVERALGSGGMGAVYQASHVVSGQAVALKWLRPKLASEPQAEKRFIREARASARIRHPNVVDIHGVEEDGGRVFLVFELLLGETLRELLKRERLGVAECLALLLPAMRGVSAAHALGVVHRDLKPENIFVTRDPDEPSRRLPKVLDFGISKLAADSPEAEGTLTATGAMLGTPHYMSLEQLQGAEVDARADVYAFGVVLYECLTGKRPFDGDSFAAIVVKAATETPVDPVVLRPELPRALSDVVLRAMARPREERHRSMQALIEAVLPFVSVEAASQVREAPLPRSAEPATASTPGRPRASTDTPTESTRTSARDALDTPAPSVSRRRARLLAAALVLAGAGAAAWWLSSPPPGSLAEPPASAPSPSPSPSPKPTPKASDDPLASPSPSPPGSDSPASSSRTAKPSRFDGGWVYLGNYAEGSWQTRYFDGWGSGLPVLGSTIAARGRSYVRVAMPGLTGALAAPRATIGPEETLKVLELARWQDGSFVWARVAPAW